VAKVAFSPHSEMKMSGMSTLNTGRPPTCVGRCSADDRHSNKKGEMLDDECLADGGDGDGDGEA
jgi:hypothetical protein